MERWNLIGGLLVFALFLPIRSVLPFKNKILSNSYPLAAKPHHKKGGSENIKSSNILPNAIIAYFDTKLETQIAIFILFCKDPLEGKHEDFYFCYCPSPLFLCISNFWWVLKIHKCKTGQTITSSTFNVTDQFQPIILQSASKNVSQARPIVI